MAKIISKDLIQMMAGRDQAIAFIRDKQQIIAGYASHHPDSLVRVLANFTLAELDTCPIIEFTVEEEDGD